MRNVPWPAETYEVTVEDRHVVLCTSNRKFFKRLSLPELDAPRPPLPLSAAALTWHHAGTTLAISYRKPAEVLAAETAEREEARATIGPMLRPHLLLLAHAFRARSSRRGASRRASRRRTVTLTASSSSAQKS